MSSDKNGSPLPASFSCMRCGISVSTNTPSSRIRNHCPNCLTSRHTTTREPRTTDGRCGARMQPISIAVLRGGDWALIQRCTGCSELADDHVEPDDNQLLLIRLAVRPLAQPPFPLEHLGALWAAG